PPPARPTKVPADRPVVEAPAGTNFSGELPYLTAASSSSTLPALPRPTDTDFLLRKADNHFNAGKKLFQDGDYDRAQREFNLAVQTLMAAPEESGERIRADKRLEELIDAIYRYDADLQADEPEVSTGSE